MKQILNFFKVNSISICIIVLLCLLIWLRGPELIIGHATPLQDHNLRFFGIALILFAVFLKFIFIDNKYKEAEKMKSSLETEKKLKHLYGKFHGAIEFLKKTVISKQETNVNLLCLPWYLLIGPTGSGKTTLLANANINYILAKQIKAPSSDICDWWVTRDLVLVDVPGNYLTSKTKYSSPINTTYHLLWQHLLKLLKKFRGKENALQGIVLAINLPEIIRFQRSQKYQLVQDTKKRVHDLLALFGNQLPIYLIITKCDLLPGFNEFFSDFGTDEAAQPWGITIPKSNENVIDVFIHRFNALIKRLNKQLISRLHQERNPNTRPYIKDFPLQIEKLKEGIAQLLKVLALPNSSLQGVYLTSGTQQHKEESAHSSAIIHNHSTQALQILTAPAMPTRSYFVRQLILHNLLAISSPQTHKSKFNAIWQRRMIYATSLGAIMTAAIFLGRDFQHSVKQAYSIQNDLAQYQLRIEKTNQKTDRLTEALPLLNALQQASMLSKDGLSFYTNKSQQTANSVYQQALQTLVIPEIKNYFEKYLQKASSQKPEDVYPVLEAYLMLGDKENFQADFVADMLQQLMPDKVSKETIKALSSHVYAALNNSTHSSVKLNLDFIENSRKQLLSLNNNDLGFVLLKNIEDNKRTILFGSNAKATVVPILFTAKAFEKVINTEVNQIARDVLLGNWILGFNPLPPDELAVSEFTTQFKREYIAKYINTWENVLDTVQLQTPQNLAELNTLLSAMTSDHSPLSQLLETIKQNTSIAPILTASPKLQTIHLFASQNQANGFYGMSASLKQLQHYLQTFVNKPEEIFAATAKRMQGFDQNDAIQQTRAIALQCPEPIRNWLNIIAMQTWHFMLQETAQYIQAAWQNNVMMTYHTAIENRYPFNQNALEEVDLHNFTRFLGQTGMISTFYQGFVKPFVNDTGKIKQWRFTDGERIPLTDTIFNKYDHVLRLQHAFFPNGDNTLYVPFTLQPLALDKQMKGFTLNINGQEVRFQKNMPRLLTWPGNRDIQVTAINFVTEKNQLLSQSIKGSWGWFKLVSKATETIHSRKELALTFNLEGHKVKYVLLTQGHLNPFLPLNLAGFELPENIQILN